MTSSTEVLLITVPPQARRVKTMKSIEPRLNYTPDQVH